MHLPFRAESRYYSVVRSAASESPTSQGKTLNGALINDSAGFVFNWGNEEVGAYITFAASTKFAFLLVIVPLVIKKLRKPAPAPERLRPTSASGDAIDMFETLSEEQRQWGAEANHL